MFEQTIDSLSKQITDECIKIFDDSDKFFRIIDSPELENLDNNDEEQASGQIPEQSSAHEQSIAQESRDFSMQES